MCGRICQLRKLLQLKFQDDLFDDGAQFALFTCSAACVLVGDNRTWVSISTWQNGLGSLIAGGAVLLSGVLLLAVSYREHRSNPSKYLIKTKYFPPVLAYLALILLWGRLGIGDASISNRSIALALLIYALLCLDRRDRVRFLFVLGFVYAIIMGLSAAFFILRYLGAPIPHYYLEPSNPLKINQGMYYELSLLGGSLINRYGNLVYCGIFDESGCLGTFSALLFIALSECEDIKKFRYSRLIKTGIIIEGALTFSFAFLIIILAYLFLYLVRLRNWKLIVIALGGILALLLLIMLIDPQHLGSLGSLRGRIISIFSGEGIPNNRINEDSALIMRRFYMSDDLLVKLFGFGQSAFNEMATARGVDGCSVEFYLYDYGYIGVALYYIVIVVLNRVAGKSVRGNWVLLFFFLVSTYQRPEVFSSLYVAILILGSIPERFGDAHEMRSDFGSFGWLKKMKECRRSSEGDITCKL